MYYKSSFPSNIPRVEYAKKQKELNGIPTLEYLKKILKNTDGSPHISKKAKKTDLISYSHLKTSSVPQPQNRLISDREINRERQVTLTTSSSITRPFSSDNEIFLVPNNSRIRTQAENNESQMFKNNSSLSECEFSEKNEKLRTNNISDQNVFIESCENLSQVKADSSIHYNPNGMPMKIHRPINKSTKNISISQDVQSLQQKTYSPSTRRSLSQEKNFFSEKPNSFLLNLIVNEKLPFLDSMKEVANYFQNSHTSWSSAMNEACQKNMFQEHSLPNFKKLQKKNQLMHSEIEYLKTQLKQQQTNILTLLQEKQALMNDLQNCDAYEEEQSKLIIKLEKDNITLKNRLREEMNDNKHLKKLLARETIEKENHLMMLEKLTSPKKKEVASSSRKAATSRGSFFKVSDQIINNNLILQNNSNKFHFNERINREDQLLTKNVKKKIKKNALILILKQNKKNIKIKITSSEEEEEFPPSSLTDTIHPDLSLEISDKEPIEKINHIENNPFQSQKKAKNLSLNELSFKPGIKKRSIPHINLLMDSCNELNENLKNSWNSQPLSKEMLGKNYNHLKQGKCKQKTNILSEDYRYLINKQPYFKSN